MTYLMIKPEVRLQSRDRLTATALTQLRPAEPQVNGLGQGPSPHSAAYKGGKPGGVGRCRAPLRLIEWINAPGVKLVEHET